MRAFTRKFKPQTLVGDRVYLRQMERGDLVHLHRWMNDKEILGLIGQVKPWSRREVSQFFERIRKEKDRAWFVVVLKEKDRVIGQAGLLRMFLPWNQTDLTIEVNEKDLWDQGFGSEAIQLLLRWAFDTLGFHRVSIGVVGFNDRALHFYKKNGFSREGISRDGYRYNGKYYDFVMMSILDHEFRGRTKSIAS